MIYTFYSYKGGVGRSMALANIAECLYRRGARVLMIDWDLEAPGLEQFFFANQQGLDGVRSRLGVIDMLLDYKRQFTMARQATKTSERDLSSIPAAGNSGPGIFETVKPNLLPFKSLLYPIHPPEPAGNPNSPALWLLPAGWRTTVGSAAPLSGGKSDESFSKYAQAVQSFDWADFYANFEGEAYFSWLRDQLHGAPLSPKQSSNPDSNRLGFDAALIDSRTGVTEMGGVCTRQLADVIVSFCAPNYQNLEGVTTMSASFLREDVKASRGGDLPEVLVVPARLDLAGETDEQNRFRLLFEESTRRPPTFERLRLEMWDLLIPYIAKYAYRESLAVGVPGSNQTLEKAYWQLATHLILFAEKESQLRAYFASDLQRLAPAEHALPLPQVTAAQAANEPDLPTSGRPTEREYTTSAKEPDVPISSRLSARAYAALTFSALLLAISFLVFYVYQVPKFVQGGVQGQIFYLLLLPWALSCAAFLYGALRTYSRSSYKHIGKFLELGGPATVFFLVFLGGFMLVPPSQSFDLTVRPIGPYDALRVGSVILDLGSDRRVAPIGTNGEASFKGIPQRFWGSNAKILIEAAGYETTTRQYTVNRTAIDVPVEPAREQLTVLRGTVFPPPRKQQSVEISVVGQNVKTKPDASGAFLMQVAGKEGDRIRLIVSVDGKVVFDEYEILPGPVAVRLDKTAPPGWDKLPLREAWCYQEKASATTQQWGLNSGFGAYCHYSDQNCEKARSGSSTASNCAYLTDINPNTWGGRPLPKGYLDSWYRQNLTAPLRSPFPIPPGQTQPSK